MSGYYIEVKHSNWGAKVVAWMSSTSEVTEPKSGGDVIIPITHAQYVILSATHGDLEQAQRELTKLRKIVSES